MRRLLKGYERHTQTYMPCFEAGQTCLPVRRRGRVRALLPTTAKSSIEKHPMKKENR